MRIRHAVLLLTVSSLTVWAQNGPAGPPAGAPQNVPAGGRGGRGGRGGPVSIKSPEVSADRTVTFRMNAPNAKELVVTVGRGNRIAMVKDERGVWSATSAPLAPDVYTYSFSLDGTTITDPSNRDFQTSFGGMTNTVTVPGAAAWTPGANAPQGAITRHTYHSAIAGDDREFFVYTPAGYDVHASAYPLLFLLHGLGDDAGRWINGANANVILDNLIAEGKARPMVMVSTLGYGTSKGPGGAMTPENITNYTKILLDEVLPTVEKSYNVSKDRTMHAIAGLSMGGATSSFVGLNHLDKFAWIGSFSGAFSMWPESVRMAQAASGGQPVGFPAGTIEASAADKTFPTLDAKANAQIRLLWVACGKSDGFNAGNKTFKAWLKAKNISFVDIETEGAHSWDVWQRNLTAFAPLLFQSK
jgi:enterochelin esterase-like enzyme